MDILEGKWRTLSLQYYEFGGLGRTSPIRPDDDL